LGNGGHVFAICLWHGTLLFSQQAEESSQAQRRVRGPLHLGRDPDPERTTSGLYLKTAETFTESAGTCEYVDDPYLIALVHCGNGQDPDTAKMVDVMSVEQRSATMSKIRGKNTGPELRVRQALWHAGLRFRLHTKGLPGRPDIVLQKWRAAIFVHGCFWHRHEGCPLFRLPATRTEFWDTKLSANSKRDLAAIRNLTNSEWRVLVVWECALKFDPAATGAMVVAWVRDGEQSAELLRNESTVQQQPFGSRDNLAL
jgi:DNA mismatch endonuclease (patch repair protein)